MPLKKLQFKPGVNKENTSYANENGWFYSQWVRFRQGTPEKIGGYVKISYNIFLGTCRSLWSWVTLGGSKLVGVGTNLKFYIETAGVYYDITPIRSTSTLGASPIATALNSSTITVTDAAGGYATNDFVTMYSTSSVGGITLLGNYQLTVGTVANTFTVTAASTVDITIANPAVFTAQYKLANAVRVSLTTTGALPSPLNSTTSYYVVNTSGYTFQLSLTSGGAAISTAGSSQYGQHTATALASSASSGGGTVYASYEITTGSAVPTAQSGWGAGGWGAGGWGVGATSTSSMRLWQQSNFNENLIFGYRGGPLYYWDANYGYNNNIAFTVTIATPAVLSTTITLDNGSPLQFFTTGALPTGLIPGTTYYVINSSGTTCNLSTTVGGSAINTSGSQSGTHTISSRAYNYTQVAGASNVPTVQNWVTVSDVSRYIIVFGTNELGSATQNPMLIRWSDAQDPANFTPAATNTAGFSYLSHGSKIVSVVQSRQEILVWTDSSLYSMQEIATGWQIQLVADNISIISPNAVAYSNGVAYWMGVDKFYRYDGRTQTLICDLRRYVFGNMNLTQTDQIFASTSEGFNEIWWFYTTATGVSPQINSYVVYNYIENNGCWYYGTLGRTAWLDSGLLPYPLAATYSQNLVEHENGVDNNEGTTTQGIPASITSSQFDVDDGHNFGFIWRTLPDVTFEGSTSNNAQLTMSLYTMNNSGSGVNIPGSVGGKYSTAVQSSGYQATPSGSSYPVQATYTGQIYTRVRGRQIIFEISSDMMGVNWQLGYPRIDIRPDGKR
jgi:hypothetical protein